MNATAVSPMLVSRLPKADLHCHLDGSLRPSTLLELARDRGVSMPANDAAQLADWMRVDDARNLEDYLQRFDVTLSVMQDVEALERVAYELVLDAAADGVRYLEIRFCPMLSTLEGLTSDEVMESIIRGAARGDQETGCITRHIVCALRSLPVDRAREMAELAVRHRGPVVAFDLAGAESGNPASRFKSVFDYVRYQDMAVTIHAGEGAGAESIRDAVHTCGAHRIGHGTRLFEDPSLMHFVIDRQVPLEVCLTSNVQTRVVAGVEAHPVEAYLEYGAFITLNTDNRLMSGVTLTDEYMACATALKVGWEDLGRLALASFDAAFLPFAERRRLRTVAAHDIAQMTRDMTMRQSLAL